MPRKAPCPCGEKTIPGLIPSVSLCQKHYDALMFGTEFEHAEARRMYRESIARYENLAAKHKKA
jgi:hypothetical protein